ncbi:MAG TPA: hypothetical protein VMU87_00660 [Stellaceae bacterium]|nr:hypothetical protein [Stellaceae bacterium]
MSQFWSGVSHARLPLNGVCVAALGAFSWVDRPSTIGSHRVGGALHPELSEFIVAMFIDIYEFVELDAFLWSKARSYPQSPARKAMVSARPPELGIEAATTVLSLCPHERRVARLERRRIGHFVTITTSRYSPGTTMVPSWSGWAMVLP